MTTFLAIALAVTILACRILDGFERAPKVRPLPKNTRRKS